MTDAKLIESQQKLIDRYEEILESIATMLDNGITAHHGAQYTWERYPNQSAVPSEVSTNGANEITRYTWDAREEANAALTFERDDAGVEE